MKKQRYIVEIEMPDGDFISSGWLKDLIQTDCDVEDEDRKKVTVQETSLSSNLDETAEEQWAAMEYVSNTAKESTSVRDWCTNDIVNAFTVGADFGAKNMLAKLRENCVIIDKDLYEIAMEGRFIEGREEGREEGKKWMAGQGVTIDGKVIMDFSEPADIISQRLIAELGDSLLEIEPGDVVVQIRKK